MLFVYTFDVIFELAPAFGQGRLKGVLVTAEGIFNVNRK